MRNRLSWITVLSVGLLAWPALAQDAVKPADDPPAGDSAMKQKLLDNFDTNHDGTLDRSEARAIGRALRENFNIGPGGPGPGPEGRGPEGRRRGDGPPPEGRGPEARRGRGPDDGPPPGDRGPRGQRRGEGRGPEGRGPDGRGQGRGFGGPTDGPPQPPRPERLFNRFDEDKDGSLSKEEFMKLSDFMRERFPMGPPPMAGRGPGRGDGPPPRGEGRGRGGEGRGRGFRGDGPPRGTDGPPPADGAEDPI
jgi:EF hand